MENSVRHVTTQEKRKCSGGQYEDGGYTSCRYCGCVNGMLEQICDTSSSVSCGIKPIPDVGCKIGRCVDGQWKQVCD